MSYQEVEKQIRVILFTRWKRTTSATATYMHGRSHTASTLMSKSHSREVLDLMWFRIPGKPKLAEWKEAHWVGKLKRADGHVLGMVRLTQPETISRNNGIWSQSSVRHISCHSEVHHESSVG